MTTLSFPANPYENQIVSYDTNRWIWSGVTWDLLPSTSTFSDLVVTGSITGNLTGNADTVTNGVYTTDTGTVTSAMLAGSISNSKLANSKVTIGSTQINLGATSTTLVGLSNITSTTFTGSLTGNAATASKFLTTHTINGIAFDGSSNITITADANTLTNTTLNNTVVNSSLTSVGPLTNLTVAGDATVNSAINVTGDVNAQSNIVVPTAPTLSTHATNKRYVDSKSIAMSIAMS